MVAGWVVMAGCSSDVTPSGDSGTTSAPVITWSEAFDTTSAGSLSGVWGSGPDDVYVVGGDEVRGEVWRWDGAAWTELVVPEVPLLVWVYGFGPDDVTAVGVGGGALHWDGTAWTSLDTGTTIDLWGVWGSAPDDLWVVGGDPDVGEPVILHGDGAGFSPLALDPAENDRLAHALFKVWGVDGRTFAVGQAGLIVEWTGSAWQQVSTGPLATEDFVSLWGTSADNIVAVGGRSGAVVSIYDGAAWTTTRPEAIPGLSAVGMLAPDEAVVGGVGGFVGHLDPATGEVVRETPHGSRDLHSIWFDGVDRTYAVGGTFYPPHVGTALVRVVDP